MNEVVSCSAGSGKFRIEAIAVRCGADWSITVCGGEQYHVGAVSLAQYEPSRDSATVSTVTVHTHRDDVVAAKFAKRFSAARKCNVTVTVGIHVDAATDEELSLLYGNSMECLCHLLQETEERE